MNVDMKIILIMDDAGNSELSFKALMLAEQKGMKLNVSILPYSKFSKIIIDYVCSCPLFSMLCHIPMESLNDKISWHNMIKNSDSLEIIENKLEDYFRIIPATWCNQHTGSLISNNYKICQFIISWLDKRKIKFIDSMTLEHESLFIKSSNKLGIKIWHRHVFLDAKEYWDFEKLFYQKKQQSHMIAIAHPATIINMLEDSFWKEFDWALVDHLLL